MANRSTSPDRAFLRWLAPSVYAGSVAAVLGMAWVIWDSYRDGLWRMTVLWSVMFGVTTLYMLAWVRVARKLSRALDRARSKGGLAHIVAVQRAGNHAGWLTLHHDTGDLGFFSFSEPSQDIYVPRHSVATISRESDGSTRVTYLTDAICSFVVQSEKNNLELWTMPAAEAHAHARTSIPTAVARIRDDD